MERFKVLCCSSCGEEIGWALLIDGETECQECLNLREKNILENPFNLDLEYNV